MSIQCLTDETLTDEGMKSRQKLLQYDMSKEVSFIMLFFFSTFLPKEDTSRSLAQVWVNNITSVYKAVNTAVLSCLLILIYCFMF